MRSEGNMEENVLVKLFGLLESFIEQVTLSR